MKIYSAPEPEFLIRVNIKKQGIKTEYITLCETTQNDCLYFIKQVIEKQNISPFQKGNITNIEIREAKGAINGKSISISFRGLEPKEVHKLILNELLQKGKIDS